jgi:glutaredoxin-related protein
VARGSAEFIRCSRSGAGFAVCYADELSTPAGESVHRLVLEEARVHPAIRDRIERHSHGLVDEVEAAVAANAVVVVGMAMNPFPRKARRMLDAAGVPYKYLEYGSYFSRWRDRLPLKMWTGWPTFPLIFVDGVFIGGADDLARIDLNALKERAGRGAPAGR